MNTEKKVLTECYCCGKDICEEEMHHSFHVYEERLEGREIQPLRHIPVGEICLGCLDDKLLTPKSQCCACGKEFEQYEEYWAIEYRKEALVSGAYEPEYGEPLARYHEPCAKGINLIDALNEAVAPALLSPNVPFGGKIFLEELVWRECGHLKS